uniref:uncharacterized protein n=1 Tax=Myxine glutinosa TaxID=7769 RepID=UPI00358DF187
MSGESFTPDSGDPRLSPRDWANTQVYPMPTATSRPRQDGAIKNTCTDVQKTNTEPCFQGNGERIENRVVLGRTSRQDDSVVAEGIEDDAPVSLISLCCRTPEQRIHIVDVDNNETVKKQTVLRYLHEGVNTPNAGDDSSKNQCGIEVVCSTVLQPTVVSVVTLTPSFKADQPANCKINLTSHSAVAPEDRLLPFPMTDVMTRPAETQFAEHPANSLATKLGHTSTSCFVANQVALSSLKPPTIAVAENHQRSNKLLTVPLEEGVKAEDNVRVDVVAGKLKLNGEAGTCPLSDDSLHAKLEMAAVGESGLASYAGDTKCLTESRHNNQDVALFVDEIPLDAQTVKPASSAGEKVTAEDLSVFYNAGIDTDKTSEIKCQDVHIPPFQVTNILIADTSQQLHSKTAANVVHGTFFAHETLDAHCPDNATMTIPGSNDNLSNRFNSILKPCEAKTEAPSISNQHVKSLSLSVVETGGIIFKEPTQVIECTAKDVPTYMFTCNTSKVPEQPALCSKSDVLPPMHSEKYGNTASKAELKYRDLDAKSHGTVCFDPLCSSSSSCTKVKYIENMGEHSKKLSYQEKSLDNVDGQYSTEYVCTMSQQNAVEDKNKTKRTHGENWGKPSTGITTSMAERETSPSLTQERVKRFFSREGKRQMVSILPHDAEREDGKIVKNAVPMNAELKQSEERPADDGLHTGDDKAKEPAFSPRSLATLIANPPRSTCLNKSTAVESVQHVPGIDKSIGETKVRTLTILGEDNCQQFAPSGRDGNMKSSHDAAPQTKREHSLAEGMLDVAENMHRNRKFDGAQQLGEESEPKRTSDLDQTQEAGAECESISEEGVQQGSVSPASPVSPVQTRKSRRKVRRVFVIEDDDSNDGVDKEEGIGTDEAEHSVVTPGSPDTEQKELSGGVEPVAEESAAREYCAFCSQDELSSLGQGELKWFNATPGLTTLQQHPSHRGSTDSVLSKPTSGPTLSLDGAVNLSAVNELQLVGMHEGASVLDLIKPDVHISLEKVEPRLHLHWCILDISSGVLLSQSCISVCLPPSGKERI